MDGRAKVAVLTPVNEGSPLELGRRLYRKQVLRAGKFNYKDRQLDFSPEYIARLVRSYQDQAYDTVPFMLADRDNAHTMDPSRYGGDVVGLEATPEGLDALISLSDDAAKLVAENPKFGVSVRILEDLERGDGEKFPAALQHVLGTFDPRMTGMRPWEAVEMSNEGIDYVLDLTDLTAPTAGSDKEGATEVPTNETQKLDPDQLTAIAEAVFAKMRDELLADEASNEDELTDAELEEIAAGVLSDEETAENEAAQQGGSETTEVAASNGPSPAEIEMASRLDRMEKENLRLRDEAAERRYVELSRELAEKYGIPPAVTALGKCWIMREQPIELSNGESRDPGRDIVTMLQELGKQIDLVDLAGPASFPSEGKSEQDAGSLDAQAEWAKQFMAEQGLG